MRWNDMAGKYVRDYMQTKDVMRWFDNYEKYRRWADRPKVEATWVVDPYEDGFFSPTVISEVVVPESESEQSALPPLEEIL